MSSSAKDNSEADIKSMANRDEQSILPSRTPMNLADQENNDKKKGPAAPVVDRTEEAALRKAEFGVVGWKENDETNFDRRSTYGMNLGGDNQNQKEEYELERIEFPHKLYGRDKALRHFQDVYAAASSSDLKHPLQLIFLKGYSGCGKTALVKEAARCIHMNFETINSPNEILIQGKFDQLLRGTPIPYRGITDALKRWYRALSADQKVALQRPVQQELEEALGGDDAERLAEILPFLAKIITGFDGSNDDDTASLHSKAMSTASTMSLGTFAHADTMNKARVHFAFQSLFKSIGKHSKSPLILFLDDLQWADTYTLELLGSLLSFGDEAHDNNNHENGHAHHNQMLLQNFVFVGSYRENEVTTDDHPVNKLIQSLENHPHRPNGATIETMAVTDLTREDITAFIADTLDLGTDEVQPLANAIFEKTLGNMFFARQALEELVRRNALYFDMVTFQWQWVLSQEKLFESLSNDLLEMVKAKIQAMPAQLQEVLVVASYMGQLFSADFLITAVNATKKNQESLVEATLEEMKESNDATSSSSSSLTPLLNQAVKEGLLTQSENKQDDSLRYSFAHDRVQEATRSLVSGEVQERILIDVGRVMVEKGTDDDGAVLDCQVFFLGMHHLNQIFPNHPLCDSLERTRMGHFNLQAAKESIAQAAFDRAADFAKRGIACIHNDDDDDKENGWQTQPELMHELHFAAADACRLSGDCASMEAYCNACLEAEKDRPMEDHLPLYYTLANGLMFLGKKDRLGEAHVILVKLLEHLGYKYARTTIGKLPGIVFDLLRLALFRRRFPPGRIDGMEFVTDVKEIQAMKVMHLLGELCYIEGDDLMTLLTIFSKFNHTMKHGITAGAGDAVASMCIIFGGVFNDFASVRAYAHYAMELMEKTNYKPIVAKNTFTAYWFGKPWVIPVADCIAPLRNGYQIGTNTGMNEDAAWCTFALINLSFQAGHHLAQLDTFTTKRVSRMEELGLTQQAPAVWGILRLFLGLRGVPRDHVTVNLEDTVSLTVELMSSYKRIELGYLGEYEPCADLAVETGDHFLKTAPGNAEIVIDMFLSALSCLEMFRKTRKRKYRKEAKRICRVISMWGKQGNPNVLHWIELFDAENAFIRGWVKVARKKYSLAVQLALEGGYKHDAAVFNQRWAVFAMETGDETKASEKIQEAVRLFREWGALEVVRRLRDQYSAYLERKTEAFQFEYNPKKGEL